MARASTIRLRAYVAPAFAFPALSDTEFVIVAFLNQLGVDYNAHLLDSVVQYVAPDLASLLGARVRPAESTGLAESTGPVGSTGPVDSTGSAMIDSSYGDISATIPTIPQRVVELDGRGDLKFAARNRTNCWPRL